MNDETSSSRLEEASKPLDELCPPKGQDATPEEFEQWLKDVAAQCERDIATAQATDPLQGALYSLVSDMDERTALLVILRETLRETTILKSRLVEFMRSDEGSRIIVPGARDLGLAIQEGLKR